MFDNDAVIIVKLLLQAVSLVGGGTSVHKWLHRYFLGDWPNFSSLIEGQLPPVHRLKYEMDKDPWIYWAYESNCCDYLFENLNFQTGVSKICTSQVRINL